MKKFSFCICLAAAAALSLYLSCTTYNGSAGPAPHISEMYLLAHPSDVKETTLFAPGEKIFIEFSACDSDMDIRRVIVRAGEDIFISLPPQPEEEALYYISVPGLEKGKHRISISVEDSAGNRSNAVAGNVTVR